MDQANRFEQILIVDDNLTNLQIMQKMLENQGYVPLLAHTGEEALQMAPLLKPSLVLLDIVLPGIDGYEVCEQLKGNPETSDITIIFLSAMEDSDAKVRGFSLGAVDFISKPFQPSEAVARVNTHMKIHRLEQQLARRNSELEVENQRILNAVNEGIVGLDQAGRITTVNPAATQIMGWAEEQCRGRELFSLGLFHTGEGLVDLEVNTLPYKSYKYGQAVQSDLQLIRRRDGEIIPVALASIPYDEGGAVLVMRDIRETVKNEEVLRRTREELEIQRQRLAQIERLNTAGELAAGIAHEVNQPLTAVTNYASVCLRMLEKPPIDFSRFTEILGKLDSQAVRAAEVIERLRQFIRKPQLNRCVITPETLVNNVIALAEVDTLVNDVSVHFHPNTQLQYYVEVDHIQLEQVILNLLRNAIEATTHTSVDSHSVIIETSLDNEMIVFKVIDRGHGISKQAEANLFKPFYSTKGEGMGVGLSICQSIINAHGGKIGHQHNVEGGSTFYFRLPCVENDIATKELNIASGS